jgi:hypothetical protein
LTNITDHTGIVVSVKGARGIGVQDVFEQPLHLTGVVLDSRQVARSGGHGQWACAVRIVGQDVGEQQHGPDRVAQIVRHRLQQSVFDTVEKPQSFRRVLLGREGIGQPQRVQDCLPPVGDLALQVRVDEPGP